MPPSDDDLVALFAAVMLILLVLIFSRTAHCCESDVCNAMRILQPAMSEERAETLADIFESAGEETEIDPLLLVAIAFRESSFSERVERLEHRGSLGELGLLQVHGAALRMRPEGCSETLEGAACQIRTGARWLAFVRERCPGSTWRWLAAYGRGRCISEQDARGDRSARIAASYYRRIGGVRW